jgi:hypothetical protein
VGSCGIAGVGEGGRESLVFAVMRYDSGEGEMRIGMGVFFLFFVLVDWTVNSVGLDWTGLDWAVFFSLSDTYFYFYFYFLTV